MSAVVLAFDGGRSYHQPWQNHELAEFYRAIEILGRAGLTVIPDMGVSDEGDPWFAFCRGDTGDVVVHFARIDGLLVATSIASKEIVRGAELRNIIDAVIRLEPLSVPVTNKDRRLFLHPAVVLTAFIAAALAFSKHADAHEIHSNTAAKGTEPHAPVAKMFATLKLAVGDVFGVAPVASADGNNALSDLSGLEAPVSLAALMSAAMAVVGPAADSVGYDPTSTETSLMLPRSSDEHSPLFLLAASLVAASDPSNGLAQEDGSSPAAWAGVSNLHDLGRATPAQTTLLDPVAAADVSAQSVAFAQSQSASAHVVAFTDNLLDHLIAPPPHIATSAVMASGAAAGDQSAPAVSETLDPASYVNLGAISPIALQILLGASPTGPGDAAPSSLPLLVVSESTVDHTHAGAAYQTASVASALSTAVATGSTTDAAISLRTIPSTIVMASNPIEALGQLVEYGLTSHPITVTVTVSTALAASLVPFTAETSQPVRMIIFDSTAINLPVFELTNGVVFASDHELGISPAQASPANVVTVDLASGGTMTLLGVVETAHLTL